MISIRVTFQSSSRRTQEGHICYLLVYLAFSRKLCTAYRLYPSEWDDGRSLIQINDSAYHRRDYLQEIERSILFDLSLLRNAIQFCPDYSGTNLLDQVTEHFYKTLRTTYLFPLMEQEVQQLQYDGKRRTALGYISTLRSFQKFRNTQDIRLASIDGLIIKSYENYLRSKGLIPNSISYYMRILRAVYNRAVEQGVTPQNNPFRKVYTGIDKTVKRAVDMGVVSQLKHLDLKREPSLSFSRDIFLFSFYTRGMPFVDVAHLTPSNLHSDRLVYKRHKTGQQLSIKLEPCILEILNKHRLTDESAFLLPILKKEGRNIVYESAIRLQNERLKSISQLLPQPIKLTTYVARHTWATVAKRKGIPLNTISECLGHDSEKTTRIYLSSLEESVVDDANALILAGI